MTNQSDLNECCAQIKLLKQLLTQPETFDLDKVLIELETKKKLLMTFKPRSYITILKDLESGGIKHPGDWVKPPKRIEEPKIDKKVIALEKAREVKAEKAKKEAEEKAILEKELQQAQDKLATIEAAKELEKEEEAKVIEEVIKETE
ncbi:MAG: hypothetical protein QIT40_gp10 [Lokiarchaeia virus VerdaV4]|uniref:Uncharacterized protein n=1 Tax=Lokiarchaeia virus VerdaV4 TaxID=3070172 RepID=A0AA35CNS0_9CAUD|nr:MAG: hypothetical protein QIT40_gp10 [Lokiarchaeia virus VerdaV4]BDI54968.1 MAG: hypothetical protein [Lokiarchaeia virus VerdaV4]